MGMRAWRKFSTRAEARAGGKGGFRGRGFPLLGARVGAGRGWVMFRDPAQAGDPYPAQLLVLFSRRDASSPSCCTACVTRGQWGHSGMLRHTPAAREVAKYPRGCGARPTLPAPRLSLSHGWVSTSRDARPTLSSSHGCWLPDDSIPWVLDPR